MEPVVRIWRALRDVATRVGEVHFCRRKCGDVGDRAVGMLARFFMRRDACSSFKRLRMAAPQCEGHASTQLRVIAR